VSFVSPLSIRFVRPFFIPPRHFSSNKKKKSGPAGVEMPGILFLFLFWYVRVHTLTTRTYIHLHTHIAITLDRSYSMGILLLLLLWPAEFFLIFSLIPSNCLCVYLLPIWVLPLLLFLFHFFRIISWTENSASQTRPKQVARLPSVHSDVCVGAVGIRPHFCPPHYTIFWGLSGIKISYENHLKITPWLGKCCCCVRLLLCEKIKNVFPISKSL
jgi:hypothetical protein